MIESGKDWRKAESGKGSAAVQSQRLQECKPSVAISLDFPRQSGKIVKNVKHCASQRNPIYRLEWAHKPSASNAAPAEPCPS